MEDFLIEMIKTSQDIRACYDSYKHIVITHQVGNQAFMEAEEERTQLWQDLLQDVTSRLDDLYLIIMGPHESESLPLIIYKNIAYARSWLGVAWMNQLQSHIFLKRMFLTPDNTFGPLRVKEPAQSKEITPELPGFTLERTSTNGSEYTLNSLDFLTPSISELESIDGGGSCKSFLKRSRSAISFLGRFGMRKKA